MWEVTQGFTTIGLVVGVGWLLAHWGVLSAGAEVTLSRLAFSVASPALLLTVLQRTSLSRVLSANLLTSLTSFAVVALVYLGLVRWCFPGSTLGSRLVGSLSAGYVNAGNLGIPIALYVLGDVAWVAPTLLVQLLVITPVYLTLLARATGDRRAPVWRSLLRSMGNPITLGVLAGLLLAALGLHLPRVLGAPIELLAATAIPLTLIAFGVSLRRGPRPAAAGSAPHLVAVVVLKTVVMPAVALGVGLALGLRGQAVFAAVVTAALPTAQNIFVYAVRYRQSVHLARDAIFVSSLVSLPVVLLIAAAYHLTTGT